MKKTLLILLSYIFVVMSASAQRARFEISFTSSTPANLSKVYVKPLCTNDDSPTVPLRLKNDKYSGSVPVSASGFYEVVMVINEGQWLSTVYSPMAKKVELSFRFDGADVWEKSSVENRAMSALNSVVTANNRKLWLKNGVSDAGMREIMMNYIFAADSIIRADRPAPLVAKYMTAWAYSSAMNFYTSIPKAQGRSLKELPYTRRELFPKPASALDNECAALIPVAMQAVYSEASLNMGYGLDGMLYTLYDNYKCAAVRDRVADMLLNRFLTRYDYALDFDGGLEYLKTVVREFELSGHYIDEYLKRKAALIGADFPEDVVLVNPDGKEVDFSTFKGKFVYVDLWASWCGPCCSEIPYLQALEKDFEGGNVVFVSISTDTDEEAWKTRMAEYNMKGNQLLDLNNELTQVLNIGGIPFFIIYDRDGKLHTYGAQRPSDDGLKKFLKELQ